jgi:RNA polymerase sigma-70 factor (ECF subfamily)
MGVKARHRPEGHRRAAGDGSRAMTSGLAVNRELVEQAQRGDHDAFTALALAVGDRLFLVAKLILRDADRAEDAVQDALVRAWRELPRLRDPDRFEAWIRRMVVNGCYDESRRERRRVDIRLVPDPSVADRSSDVVVRERLGSGFQRLSIDQRAVLVLHHYVGLSLPEVAESVGAPLGTVKSRLHYATRAMRAALEADDRVSAVDDRSRLA